MKTLDKIDRTLNKKADGLKPSICTRNGTSTSKRKPKPKISNSSNFEIKDKPGKKEDGHSKDTFIIKQASQPSLGKKEVIQPQQKISLGHLKSEIYSGDHRQLSYEKVQFCIKKSMDNVSLSESKRSYLVSYSSDDLQKHEEVSLYLQNISAKSATTISTTSGSKIGDCENPDTKDAIRTLSGNKLIIPSCISLNSDKAEVRCDDLQLAEILQKSEKTIEKNNDFPIFNDETNEYDSEVSTDAEITGRILANRSRSSEINKKTANSVWKTREAELLNDVDYRQSVYHPAISRRQNDESELLNSNSKNKPAEDDYDFGYKSKNGSSIQNRSQNLKTRCSVNFSTDKEDIFHNRLVKFS